MKNFPFSVLKAIALVLLISSCSITRPWPKLMKPVTYSGRVINERTGKGVANAEIRFSRPPHMFAKSTMGDWAVMGTPQRLGTFQADTQGNFTATINAGYATSAWAESGNLFGHIGTADQNHADAKPLPNEFEIKIAPFTSTIIQP